MEEDDLFPSFEVDIPGMMSVIIDKGYKKVLLQGPEGMKRGMMHLSQMIEERTGVEVWIDGEPCYGACDHAGERAKSLGIDALIHLGHSDIPSMDREGSVPIHFFHVTMRGDPRSLNGYLSALKDRISGNRIALFTTIQHIDLLDGVKEYLEEWNINVHIGGPGGREELPGQVLGCSFSAASEMPQDIHEVVFIGSGRFHPLGLCMATGKSVMTFDPVTGDMDTITSEDLDRKLRARFASIERSKDLLDKGKTAAVVIGYKPGQRRLELANKIIDDLESSGFSSRMFVMDHLDPMKLRAFGLRVVINTSCPRISIDDHSRYHEEGITLLTPIEARIALGMVPWEDYKFDEEW